MDAKEVIQEFKRIDGWQSKKKSALYMTKKDLAEYAKVEQESNQKKLNILNEYHQLKSEEEAQERMVVGLMAELLILEKELISL